MEASNIPEAQKGTTGSKQCEGDTVFFHYRGVVHLEYAPLGQAVNKEYYQVLHHLREAVRRKRPEL
jgi:hypothetical protein